MDNGGEFKREFKEKLEDMTQSNSIVERSNGVLKRILNKLIFIHADQDYSKWSEYLEQAVQIYTNK